MATEYNGPKYVVVTGGVISGVGKGLTIASIGKILQQYGYSTTAVKIDPYINYDAGTMRPTEHGEVWVTDDGGEIDQDLGNYERFLGLDLPRSNNLTTGQIYHTVIERERRGKYLGETVQPIPHITDEITRRLQEAGSGYDIVLVEIGGIVGDYENEPFLFAVKTLERDLGKEHFAHVLVTYLPIPPHIGEMKTKPTQQAIRMLREHGIFPDFIVCRAEKPTDEVRKKKIQIGANVPNDHIISAPDSDTIYNIPLVLEKEKLGEKILSRLGCAPKKNPDWERWKELVKRSRHSSQCVRVAMVGKYVATGDFQLTDSYISVNQSLLHAGVALDARVEITWIDSHQIESGEMELAVLGGFDGIIVPGAFGAGGAEGVIKAIRYAREYDIPYLGLCYGLQLAVIEYARNVAGITEATSEEFDPNAENKVICSLNSQKEVLKQNRYGGSMRLGAYAAVLKENSLVSELYRKSDRLSEEAERIKQLKNDSDQEFRVGLIEEEDEVILERHRHRYEVSPHFVELLEKKEQEKEQEKKLVFSGCHRQKETYQETPSPDLIEFIELSKHPFFIATQAHPEFKSRMDNPSPLFAGFIEAAQTRYDKVQHDKIQSDVKPLFSKSENRIDDYQVVRSFLWRLRTGKPWKDLPEGYPSSSTCQRRLSKWKDEGIWSNIQKKLLVISIKQVRFDSVARLLVQLDKEGRHDKEGQVRFDSATRLLVQLAEQIQPGLAARLLVELEKQGRLGSAAKLLVELEKQGRLDVAAELLIQLEKQGRLGLAAKLLVELEKQGRLDLAARLLIQLDEQQDRLDVAARLLIQLDEQDRLDVAARLLIQLDEQGRLDVAARLRSQLDEQGRLDVAARLLTQLDEQGRLDVAARLLTQLDEQGRPDVAGKLSRRSFPDLLEHPPSMNGYSEPLNRQDPTSRNSTDKAASHEERQAAAS